MTEKDKAIQELARRVESLGQLRSVEPATVSQLVMPALDELGRLDALPVANLGTPHVGEPLS